MSVFTVRSHRSHVLTATPAVILDLHRNLVGGPKVHYLEMSPDFPVAGFTASAEEPSGQSKGPGIRPGSEGLGHIRTEAGPPDGHYAHVISLFLARRPTVVGGEH